MAESAEENTTVDRKLHEIFEEAFDLYNSFETCNDPTNSPEFQVSTNRFCAISIDCEIATNNLKIDATQLSIVMRKILKISFVCRQTSRNVCVYLRIVRDW